MHGVVDYVHKKILLMHSIIAFRFSMSSHLIYHFVGGGFDLKLVPLIGWEHQSEWRILYPWDVIITTQDNINGLVDFVILVSCIGECPTLPSCLMQEGGWWCSPSPESHFDQSPGLILIFPLLPHLTVLVSTFCFALHTLVVKVAMISVSMISASISRGWDYI